MTCRRTSSRCGRRPDPARAVREPLAGRFRLYEGSIAPDEEAFLLDWALTVPMAPYVMRGQASRRLVARWGAGYGPGDSLGPLPPPLVALRDRILPKLGVGPARGFTQGMVSRYPPGAGIGWHRDFAAFDVIVGVSLAAAVRMRLRPVASPRATVDVQLPARSVYVLSGPARTDWEHHLPPVTTERWSITFRSLRRRE